jgi:hypothetical protein
MSTDEEDYRDFSDEDINNNNRRSKKSKNLKKRYLSSDSENNDDLDTKIHDLENKIKKLKNKKTIWEDDEYESEEEEEEYESEEEDDDDDLDDFIDDSDILTNKNKDTDSDDESTEEKHEKLLEILKVRREAILQDDKTEIKIERDIYELKKWEYYNNNITTISIHFNALNNEEDVLLLVNFLENKKVKRICLIDKQERDWDAKDFDIWLKLSKIFEIIEEIEFNKVEFLFSTTLIKIFFDALNINKVIRKLEFRKLKCHLVYGLKEEYFLNNLYDYLKLNKTLQKLAFTHCNFIRGDIFFKRLTEIIKKNISLNSINISNNQMSFFPKEEILLNFIEELKNNNNLSTIILENQLIEDHGVTENSIVKKISEMIKSNRSIKILNLNESIRTDGTDDSFLQFFKELSINNNIEQIFLSNLSLKSNVISEVANMIKKNKTIKVLDLRKNMMGSNSSYKKEFLELIKAFEFNNTIEYIDLSGNLSHSYSIITERYCLHEFICLGDMIRNTKTVKTLLLNNENDCLYTPDLKNQYFYHIFKSLKFNNSISNISLSGYKEMNSVTCKRIGSMLLKNSTLTHLNISNNSIEQNDDSILPLYNGLILNKTLIKINLSGTGIEKKDSIIMNILKSNSNLISYTNNKTDDNNNKKIQKYLKENRKKYDNKRCSLINLFLILSKL